MKKRTKIFICCLTALFAVLTALFTCKGKTYAYNEENTNSVINIWQAYRLRIDFNQIQFTFNNYDTYDSDVEYRYYFTDGNGNNTGYISTAGGGGVQIRINSDGVDSNTIYSPGDELTVTYNSGVPLFLDGTFQSFYSGYPQGPVTEYAEYSIPWNITFTTMRTSLQAYIESYNQGFSAGYLDGKYAGREEEAENVGSGGTGGNYAYRFGYNEGYRAGMNDEENNNLYFEQGKDVGYAQGYLEGSTTYSFINVLFNGLKSFFLTIVNAVTDFMNLELSGPADSFIPGLSGVKMGYFMCLPLIFTSIGFLFSAWRGGDNKK